MVVGDPSEGVLVMIGMTWCCDPIIGCLCSGPMTSPGRCGDGLSGVVSLDSAAVRCAMIFCMTTSLISLANGSFVSGGGEFQAVGEIENAGEAECCRVVPMDVMFLIWFAIVLKRWGGRRV
jgi:hypothetical protein